MHRQLNELFHEKAQVEAKIRRIRIIAIRKAAARIVRPSTNERDGKILHLVEQMDDYLRVSIIHLEEFDQLLDQIEAYLFDN